MRHVKRCKEKLAEPQGISSFCPDTYIGATFIVVQQGRAGIYRGLNGELCTAYMVCSNTPESNLETEMLRPYLCRFAVVLFSIMGGTAITLRAQSFNVQCPTTTTMHPRNSGAPGAIKCQQVSGGDGFATMADGNQIFLFGFGPLSGLADIQAGLPGTETAAVFNSTSDKNRALTSVGDIMDTGVLNAESPGPTMAIDEDDEFYLTLTNVGMIMRPDLFEQHTIHFHGYPNASSYFDGVPDASVAINIGGSMTYYYTAPDAGT